MTPDELRAALKTLGLTQEAFARTIKSSTRAVEHWLAGERKIPGPAVVAVDLLLERANKINAENCK